MFFASENEDKYDSNDNYEDENHSDHHADYKACLVRRFVISRWRISLCSCTSAWQMMSVMRWFSLSELRGTSILCTRKQLQNTANDLVKPVGTSIFFKKHSPTESDSSLRMSPAKVWIVSSFSPMSSASMKTYFPEVKAISMFQEASRT